MKKNIAVLYGGYSAESEISIQSGKYVASVINKEIFNIFEIHIQKHSWKEITTNQNVDKTDFSINYNGKKIKFDKVIIEIHGHPGENGILQSYFDLINVKYIGCNAFCSALTFSKFYYNNFLRSFNVKIANSLIVNSRDNYIELFEEIIEEIKLPLFIKPNSGGSSFGIAKVTNKKQLHQAIIDAFEHSTEVMIEEFIEGREITCGVVETDSITAFTPLEVISKNDFFDYQSKYNSELNQEIIPAPVDEKILSECKKISEKIYKLTSCSGIVRIDYILKNNELYFLELNSIPGMTSESIVPKMLRYDGVSISSLMTYLLMKK